MVEDHSRKSTQSKNKDRVGHLSDDTIDLYDKKWDQVSSTSQGLYGLLKQDAEEQLKKIERAHSDARTKAA